MKKLFLILACTFFVGSMYAQSLPLPDGSFENWTEKKSYDKTPYHEIDGNFWATLNFLSTLPPELSTGPITAFREAGRTGGFCAKIVSKTMIFGLDSVTKIPLFLPGVIGNVNVKFETQSATFGRPFAARPDTLKGYFKYESVDKDSAEIYIEMYKFENKRRKVVGRGNFICRETVKDWTSFAIPVLYTNDGMPDSITILAVASAGYNFDTLFNCKGHDNSTLWVDDFSLVYSGVGIENQKTTSVGLYPNPAKESIQIKANSDFNGAIFTIYDMSGRSIKQVQLDGQNAEINISEMNNGMYVYRIQKGATTLNAGKLTVAK
ncbi:MAG: PCMD domain-containing protein [Bacteroidales bacterium]